MFIVFWFEYPQLRCRYVRTSVLLMVIFFRLFKITQLRCWVICTSVLFVVWSWTYTLSTTPDHLVCFLWFCSVGSDATQKPSVDFNITATRLRLVVAVHPYYVCLFWFDNFIRPSATLLGYLYISTIVVVGRGRTRCHELQMAWFSFLFYLHLLY